MKSFMAASGAALLVLSIMWGAAQLNSRFHRGSHDQPLVVDAVEHPQPSR
jgi:hypothetical protein